MSNKTEKVKGPETGDSISEKRAELAILATVALSTMLAPLNSTMIAVALPRIMEAFDAKLITAGWLVTAYLIAMASLQPVAGKLGDRLGRRRLILIGLVYFGFVSLGAAMATSLPALLFFRVQQGIAGAIALPNGMALVREVVPAERRARSFGLIGAAVVLAAAAGPPLAGFLVQFADWPAIFYANLLLILPALLIGIRALPSGRTRREAQPFDVAGAILLLVILSGAAALLTQARWANVVLDPTLGVVLLLGVTALFIWREWRHPDPVLQPRFFRLRTFAAANAGIALSNLAMYTTFLSIPILLSARAGWTSAKTGLVLAALWTPTVICAPLGGRLADRWGRRWPTVFGLSLFTLGLLALALAGAEITLPSLITSLAAGGIGLGLSSAGLQTAVVEAVEPHEAGVASGIFSTSRYLGSIIGSSVLASLLHSTHDTGGFSTIFWMIFGAAFLAALVCLSLHDRPGPQKKPA